MERMREKRSRGNEGGRERADYSSGVNLPQSDQRVRWNNSLQLHTVDTQAAQRGTRGKDFSTATLCKCIKLIKFKVKQRVS